MDNLSQNLIAPYALPRFLSYLSPSARYDFEGPCVGTDPSCPPVYNKPTPLVCENTESRERTRRRLSPPVCFKSPFFPFCSSSLPLIFLGLRLPLGTTPTDSEDAWHALIHGDPLFI